MSDTSLAYAGNISRTEHPTAATGKVLPVFKVSKTTIANAHATPLTLADIPELSFPVAAGRLYKFKLDMAFTAAAITTGSRWTINGPAAPTFLSYTSWYTLTALTETVNYSSAYQLPAAANASSLLLGNQAVIEGFIVPSINGAVVPQFASEITLSAITFKYGTLEVWDLGVA